jgi:hypothetical protein
MSEHLAFRAGPMIFGGNPPHWLETIEFLTEADAHLIKVAGYYVPAIFKRLGSEFYVLATIILPQDGSLLDVRMFSNN